MEHVVDNISHLIRTHIKEKPKNVLQNKEGNETHFIIKIAHAELLTVTCV